jgi:hypothetical protein
MGKLPVGKNKCGAWNNNSRRNDVAIAWTMNKTIKSKLLP